MSHLRILLLAASLIGAGCAANASDDDASTSASAASESAGFHEAFHDFQSRLDRRSDDLGTDLFLVENDLVAPSEFWTSIDEVATDLTAFAGDLRGRVKAGRLDRDARVEEMLGFVDGVVAKLRRLIEDEKDRSAKTGDYTNVHTRIHELRVSIFDEMGRI